MKKILFAILSFFIVGNSFATTITSTTTGGNWSTTGTWVGGVVPLSTDDVIIANGATVILTANHQCVNLTVGQGTSGILQIGSSSTVRTLTVTGNTTIAAGGTLTEYNGSAANQIFLLAGNLSNAGTFSGNNTGKIVITFNGSAAQSISGAGTYGFNAITVGNAAGVTISVNTLVIGGTTTLTAGALVLPTGVGNLVTFTGAISATSGTLTGSTTSNIVTNGVSTNLAFTSGGQNLNNLTVNSTFGSSTPVGLNSALTINGTLTLSGAADIYSSSSGNLIIANGATFDEIANGWYRGAGSITISSGATFKINDASGLTSSGANGVVQTTGSRTFSGGANYTFNYAGAQVIGDALDATGGGAGTGKTGIITGNVVVLSTTSLTLNTGTTITINSPGSFTLGSATAASTLIASSTSIINGSGNVTFLGNGATIGSSLQTAHANGVNGTFPGTGTLSLTNGANNNTNFTFNGAAVQTTGSLLPATIGALAISNTLGSASPTADVTLSSSVTVNGTFTNSGRLGVGANTLTLNGAITFTANKLAVSSTSTIIISGSGAISGASPFVSGGVTLNNFTLNRSAQTFTVNSAMTTSGTFTLTSGILSLGAGLILNGNISFGAGTITGGGSPVTIGGTGTITGTITATATPLALSGITMNRTGATLALGSSVTLSNATGLTLTAGNISLGSFNITSTGANGLGSGSTGSMLVATGSGQAFNTIPISAFVTQTWPIGDGTNYTPVILTFTVNGTIGTVGVKTTASTNGNINVGTTPTAYLARYWTFTNTLGATYTYSGTFRYISPGDVTGTEANLKLSRYNGVAWTEYSGSSVASPVLSSGTLTQATGPLTLDYTGRTGPAAVNYTWAGTTNDWNTASNWSPSGVPTLTDNAIIDGSLSAITATINSGSFSINNLTLNGTGAFAMASGTTLNIGGTVTYGGSATATLDCASTINYNGTSAQSVIALNYGSLNLTGGNRTLASTGTIGICGTYTPGSGTITATGSTIDFNSSSTQTIPAATYNNLTSSSTGARTLAGSGIIAVAGIFTPGANAYTSTGSTIDFSSAAAQTIPAFNYNILTNSGNGNRTLASSGIIGIATSFSNGSGVYTVTGSTVDYNGTAGITFGTFTYNNLTISNNKAAGTVSFGAGTITIGGILSYTATNSTQAAGTGTVVFNSASSQTIPALNYFNLTTSGGARTLVSSGTINIGGTTFTSGSGPYTVTGSTVNFSSSTGLTIPSLTPAATNNYNNLTISGSGTYPLAASTTISGTFSQSAGIVTVAGASAVTLAVTGNLNQSGGTFTVSSGAGVGALTVGGDLNLSGSPSIFNVTNSGSAPNTTVTVTGNLSLSNTARLLLEPTSTASTASVVNVTGNFTSTATGTATSGPVDWGAGSANSTLSGNNITIGGNFTKSGVGTFYTTGGTTGTAPTNIGFIFNKAGTQTFSYTGATSDYTSYTINSGSTLQLTADFAMGVSTSAPQTTFTVNGIYDMQTFKMTGMSASANAVFTLASGATLKTANTLGINDGTSSSSLGGLNATATKIYNAAANYQFYGTSAITNTNFVNTIMNNLAVSNTNTVIMGGSATVNGTLTLTSGNLAVASNTLTLNGGAISIASGNLVTTSSSNLLFGGTNAGPLLIPASVALLNNLTVNNTNATPATVSMNSSITVSGAAAFTSGELAIGSNTLTLSGSTTRTSGLLVGSTGSNLAVSGTGALGTIAFDQTTNSVTNALSVLTINRTSSGTVTLGSTLNVLTTATFNAGALNINGNILRLGGTVSTGGGTITAAPGTVTFNGSSAQSIPAAIFTTNAAANITIANAAGVTFNGSVAVSGTFQVNAGAIFTPVSTAIISGAGTLTGGSSSTAVAQVTRATGTGDFVGQYSITNKTLTNLMVEFIGAAAQGVGTNTFGGLKISNASGVNMSGNVTVGAGLNLNTGNLAINGNTLTISGAVTRTSGNLAGGNTSNIVIGGTAGSLFFDGTSTNNFLKSLTLNAGATATLGNALNITSWDGTSNPDSTGILSVANTAVLTTGGLLTLKSDANGTARVAANTSGTTYISGDVTVERYLRSNTNKGWRLLASNTNGAQSINAAWQEGQANSLSNTSPGFGIQISAGNTITTSLSTAQTMGFDTLSTGVALFNYNPATDGLETITNTLTTSLSSQPGYFVFIRGDRRVGGYGAGTSPTSATVLRSKAALFQGAQTTTTGAKDYGLARNPYASRIDLRNITFQSNINTSVQVWDPALGGAYGVGGYVTLTKSGADFIVANTSPSYGAANTVQNFVESGAAFFIQSSIGAVVNNSIIIPETAKATGSSNPSFRPATPLAGQQRASFNVYANNAGNFNVVDGGLVFFDNAFSNAVDINDVRKSGNFGENFGLTRDNVSLVVERRALINNTDTLFFDMNNLRQIGYRLDIEIADIDPLINSAVLEDKFTNTSTALTLGSINAYNFMVTADAASKAADRFRVVFTQATPLPVNFVSIKAAQAGNNIAVEWKVANELSVKSYTIEKSTDGTTFTQKGAVEAAGASVYNWLDANAVNGSNYYRIKSIDYNGRFKYSQIVRVQLDSKPGISVSQNPIRGNFVNLQFTGQAAGKYGIRIINSAGQVVYNSQFKHNGGNASQSFVFSSSLVAGIYQLEVVAPDNTIHIERLVIIQGN